MDLGFVIGLAVIFLCLATPIIYFGKKASRNLELKSPQSIFADKLTPTGNALYACLFGFWGICLAAREFAPDSKLGAFVGTVGGVAAVITVSILISLIAALVLRELGLPVTQSVRRDG